MAFVVPGTGLLTAGGIGTALLLRKAWFRSRYGHFVGSRSLQKLVKDPRFVENDHGDVYRWWKDFSEEKKETDGFFRL